MIVFHNFHNRLLIATVFCLSVLSVAIAKHELKLVNVLFRHGDRTPEKSGTYPNDPHINNPFYPMGHGQLTPQGKMREYKLGKVLRRRYDHFLGRVYLPKIITAQSSDFDRTKMSLQLVLAGLFPPIDIQQWNQYLNWQPIPTSYLPRIDDNIFNADECPKYIEEYERILNLPEVRELTDGHRYMLNDLTQLTGKKIAKPIDIFHLYHTLVSESFMGLPLPEWAHYYFPKGQLFDAMVMTYQIFNYNTLLKRLFAGPLINVMIDNMIDAMNNNSSETKMHLYSGHETNIASLLHAFDVYWPHVPEYSCSIILELHQIDSEYYVKLLYYLGIPSDIIELQIPGCDVLCHFDQFLDIVSDLIPSDEELICDKRLTPDFANTPYPAVVQEIMYELMQSSKK